MRLLPKLLGTLLALLITSNPLPASADTVGPLALSFNSLVTGADYLQPVYSTFSFPRFDPSLGSLTRVDLAFSFSGTVAGSATGVSQSSSFSSSIDHWVFFDFVDTSDNVAIASPDLRLTRSIPGGAQNATILFGPEFQSTSISFSVASGDPRFNAWRNGPGDVSGRLGVYFSNTTLGTYGLQFYHGTDTGVYSGSFSIAYEYVAVPEPKSLVLTAVALLLFASSRRRHLCR